MQKKLLITQKKTQQTSKAQFTTPKLEIKIHFAEKIAILRKENKKNVTT